MVSIGNPNKTEEANAFFTEAIKIMTEFQLVKNNQLYLASRETAKEEVKVEEEQAPSGKKKKK